MLQRVSLALSSLLVLAAPAQAQDPLGWNSQRATDLITRARERRELPRGDSTLRNYQSKANGYVYFYLDRRETDERTLVKVDQIALDLFWKRPNLTKQRIVGLRDVSRLPNRMYYHLDHLTVVQNNLGDVIRIGDGDEVRDVPHPAAPGADTIYDFRLADSVTLQLGAGQPDVRVYEIQVRPKRTDRSAFIGSVFVDRAAADIVRMTFTFTPVSYVDKRLDYINISLDNGLFGGKYWLPNEQSVEIRRQIPQLDFAAGAIIKGRFRIGDYRFNEPIPDSVFYGLPVSAATETQRENYPFPDDIYAGVIAEGLAPPPQMQDLRAQAAELLGQTRLSGLPAWRVYIPNASSVVRHNQAEGWYGGAGVAYVPSPTFRTDLVAGHAFGANRPEVAVSLRYQPKTVEITARAYYNEPRDIGPFQGVPGVLNTFSSAFDDRDYTDLYFTRGVSLRFASPRGPNRTDVVYLRGEQHRPAFSSGEYSSEFFGVERGTALEAGVQVIRPLAERDRFRWGASALLGYVYFRSADALAGDAHFPRLALGGEVRANSVDQRKTLIGRLDLAATSAPSSAVQYNYLLGGRETLPAYGYRSLDTDAFALARLELAQTLAYPWIRLRLLGAASYTKEGGEGDIIGVTRWESHASGGVGVGLLWDVIRLDLVNGTRSAAWRMQVSVRRDFWDML